MREATLIALGFCLAAGIIVWLRPLLRPRRWLLLVGAFTVLDLGLIAGTSGLVDHPVECRWSRGPRRSRTRSPQT